MRHVADRICTRKPLSPQASMVPPLALRMSKPLPGLEDQEGGRLVGIVDGAVDRYIPDYLHVCLGGDGLDLRLVGHAPKVDAGKLAEEGLDALRQR